VVGSTVPFGAVPTTSLTAASLEERSPWTRRSVLRLAGSGHRRGLRDPRVRQRGIAAGGERRRRDHRGPRPAGDLVGRRGAAGRGRLARAAAGRPGDVVATNTLCLLPRLPDVCDARGYIVSGLGGRRAYIEGWAYTAQSMRHQQPGIRYTKLPLPWPDRVQLTNQAVTRPSVVTMDELKGAGVRWLFVDNRCGVPDTEGLLRYADQRFDNGEVQIYELR
jgi:hypothetical protein